MKKYLFYISILFISCKETTISTTHAVYHWKSNSKISKEKESQLNDLNISKIYLRYFDVDWNDAQQRPVPKGKLSITGKIDDSIEIIPTIFITNRTFQKEVHLESLVQKTINAISGINKSLPNSINEIQLDCDWTITTKDKYFDFLKLIKKKSRKKISATIRLHQIKFFEKTGVPPVDRGMLMYYNMGEVKKMSTTNSILDNKIGLEYLSNLKSYPLSLDVALPVYSWAVIFRDNKLIRLINNVVESDFDPSKYLKISKNQYKVLKSTFLYGTYLYEDDIVRYEKVSKSDLIDAAKLLSENLSCEDRTISFYHMDSKLIDHYEIEFLQKIYHSFNSN